MYDFFEPFSALVNLLVIYIHEALAKENVCAWLDISLSCSTQLSECVCVSGLDSKMKERSGKDSVKVKIFSGTLGYY